MRIISAVIALLFVGDFEARSTNVDSLFMSIDTIEVVSYKIPMKLYETGRDIQVIKGEDLKNLPAKSLDEMLRFIPGIEVQSRGPSGVQADFSIRGSTFSQVLVLIDGVRWNDPLTGHFNSNLPVHFQEIDRIEILKGASSALYGSDAMGGVINIVTKTKSDTHHQPLLFSGEITAGEYGLFSGNLHFHLKPTDRTTVSIGGSSHNASGHPDIEGDPYYFNLHHGTLAIHHRFSDDWNLFYRGAYDYRDFSAKYFYTASPFDQAEEVTKALWNQLSISKNNARGKTELDLYHKRNQDQFLFNPDFPPANNHLTTLSGIRLNNWISLSPGNDLNFGIRGNLRDIESNDRGNHSDYTMAIYGAYQYQWSQRSSLNLAVSLDRDENFGWELSPQLSYSLAFENLTLRASAGRSIRAADYTERYISTNLPGPLSSGRNLGNPALRAERANQLDLGATIKLTPGFQLHTGVYYRKGKNIIDYVLTEASEIPENDHLDPEGIFLYAENIAEVDAVGFNIQLLMRQLEVGSTFLRAELAYTFNDLSTAQEVNAKYITGQARHLAQLNLHFTNGPWRLSLSGMYKDREDDFSPALETTLPSSYAVFNGKLEYRFLENSLGLQLDVHNIANTTYSDILAVQMPGRWISGGINWQLD